MKKTIAALTVVIALSLGLSGCAGAEHPLHAEKATPAAVAKPTPTPTPKPDGTLAHPYPFGTVTVTDPGSQWDVTLSNPDTNANDVVASQDQYSSLEAGDQWLTVTITAAVNKDIASANVGQSTSVAFSLNPVYVGNDGKIYPAFGAGSAGNSNATLKNDWFMQPQIVNQVGVKSSGDAAIPVPTAALPGGHFGIQNSTSQHIVYFQ